jgi:transcriptional antiterminator Rof (Rho-off)
MHELTRCALIDRLEEAASRQAPLVLTLDNGVRRTVRVRDVRTRQGEDYLVSMDDEEIAISRIQSALPPIMAAGHRETHQDL